MLRKLTLIIMAVVLGLAVFAGCSNDAVTSTDNEEAFGKEAGKAYGYVYEDGEDVYGATVKLYGWQQVEDVWQWVLIDQDFSGTSGEDGYYEVAPLFGLQTYYKLTCTYEGAPSIQTYYFVYYGYGDEYHNFNF